MTETIDPGPDPYHTLRAMDRDHLLAIALANAERVSPPSQRVVGETIGRVTGDAPAAKTTSAALARLEDAGLVKRESVPDAHGAMKAVTLTDDGKRVLERGAARLNAAATVADE